MIVIAGDSWGTGELEQATVKHGGLAEFLRNQGHQVENVSMYGGSNFQSLQNLDVCLRKLLLQNRIKEVTHIYVFQSEWHRDLRRTPPEFLGGFMPQSTPDDNYWLPKVCDQEFISKLLSRWQYKLSALACNYDIQIGLIGGCSDTMWLDNFGQEYPGLYIACQSFTNLCVNNLHRIDNPVFNVWMPENLIDYFKKVSGSFDNLKYLTDQIQLGLDRISVWESYPEWFYPDSRHANRQGHKKLFEFLQDVII